MPNRTLETGKLVGCDINPLCAQLLFEDQRIAVVVGDANSDEVQNAVLAHAPRLHIVIDDGSHRSSDHCSYWQEFEGGLFDPLVSIAFFKQLADVVNHEHRGVREPPSSVPKRFFQKYQFQIADFELQHVHSIEFINSMCVARKLKPERNHLGARFIAGRIATVVPGHWDLHATTSYALDQTRNPLTNERRPSDMARELTNRVTSAIRRRAVTRVT